MVNLAISNFSNEPLFTNNKGNILSWWDDENPVYVNDIFTSISLRQSKDMDRYESNL